MATDNAAMGFFYKTLSRGQFTLKCPRINAARKHSVNLGTIYLKQTALMLWPRGFYNEKSKVLVTLIIPAMGNVFRAFYNRVC